MHSPINDVPQKYLDIIDNKNLDLKPKQRNYSGALLALDSVIGRMIETLKKYDLEENTFILFTSDNGPQGGTSAPYKGGKGGHATQYDGWVHTPGIAYWPKVIPAGGTFDGMMCTLDYYATIAAAIGKPLPERCDGKNILPYLAGTRKGDVHEFLYWHNSDPRDAKHRRLYAVRWKNWRLRKDISTDQWMLFDLHQDKKETTDIRSAQIEVFQTMLDQYNAFIKTLPSLEAFPKPTMSGGSKSEGWGWMIQESS